MQSLRARHMRLELETVKSSAIRLSVNTILDRGLAEWQNSTPKRGAGQASRLLETHRVLVERAPAFLYSHRDRFHDRTYCLPPRGIRKMRDLGSLALGQAFLAIC